MVFIEIRVCGSLRGGLLVQIKRDLVKGGAGGGKQISDGFMGYQRNHFWCLIVLWWLQSISFLVLSYFL